MDWDVIVVGSGAAGMTAALTGAKRGSRVLVVEKTQYFGGTTAISGGGIWIPGNPQSVRAGILDSRSDAQSYVWQLVGAELRRDLLEAFLDAGPAMVAFLEAESEVRYELGEPMPDWHPEIPGARDQGRLLYPVAYDGRRLGADFALLRPPRPEFNAPGGFMIDFADLPYLDRPGSPRSLRHLGALALRYGADRVRRYPRGTRLTMGNALVARLLRSCRAAGVEFRSAAPMKRLLRQDGRVTGIATENSGGTEEARARQGVVLASGGFSANPVLRREYVPYPEQHVSTAPEGNTGDGMTAALEIGASLDGSNASNAAWTVVSVLERPDGSTARFSHLLDMAKPGCIAVDRRGLRFASEASMSFVEAMHATGSVPAFLVCDRRFITKYGLGMVYKGRIGLKRLKKAGYIVEAPDLRVLAGRLGIDADGLAETVTRANADARSGEDRNFGKGDTVLDRMMGDPAHTPNPCLGTLDQPPFYAVTVWPGDGNTTLGLTIDPHARVLDSTGVPIDGLYACGLDANSLWRGHSPAHGAHIGLAMTFGYIAGTAVAGERLEELRS